MSPDEPGLVVPVPRGRWRAVLPMVGLAWATFQVTCPTRYYRAGADPYDERFAWRMFSDTRMQSCAVAAVERDAGGERTIELSQVLPAPWISLIERNRPAVVARFLAWRCERVGVEEVRLVSACSDASGRSLDAFVRAIDCGSGEWIE